jgi:alpha-mannosidase
MRFLSARCILLCGGMSLAPLISGGTSAADDSSTLHMVSVAHLDTQWRWTVRDSIDPYLRHTLEDNFRLFEAYPDYLFNFEGAFRYALMKQYYPDLYERMKAYIEAGRWHVAGAALDAPDVVLPAPESVLRSMLYAQQFYRSEFGLTATDAFLPDCFGFPVTFPTLAAHVGLRGFSTQKLGWGSSVGIPFHVGIWEGIDGTALPAVLHAGPYNWQLRRDVSQDEGLWHMVEAQRQAAGFPIGYRYFGVGDRGGAPDESTVAWIARAVREGKGPLRVQFARSDAIFDHLFAAPQADLPRYQGELLMTRHGVGSYTSYAPIKQWSRDNERLALAAERAAVAAWLQAGVEYPATALREAWLRFLWHHQHDGITGTSIPEANDIMINDQVIAHNAFQWLLQDAVARRAALLDLRGEGVPVIVYNPSPFDRMDTVAVHWPDELPAHAGLQVEMAGVSVPFQVVGEAPESRSVLFEATVPALGLQIFHLRATAIGATPSRKAETEGGTELALDALRVRIDERGLIASIRDTDTGEEWLEEPITWQLLPNTPSEWPAWEIEYADIMAEPEDLLFMPLERTAESDGVFLSALRLLHSNELCVVRKDLSVQRRCGRPVIQIEAEIDWRMPSRLLKVAFPVGLEDPIARYDVGLGSVVRGVNTDQLYEVPAQDWAALGEREGSKGLAVISHHKAGWDHPRSNVLRHTLIHAPNDQITDFGRHRVSFTLIPQKVAWSNGLHRLAEQVVQPLMAFAASTNDGTRLQSDPIMVLDTDAVRVMALKKAESGESIIVRVGEISGRNHEAVRLSFPAHTIASIDEVNGLEDQQGKIAGSGNGFTFSMRAYQLRSFEITLEREGDVAGHVSVVPIGLDYDVAVTGARGTKGRARRIAVDDYPASIQLGDVEFELAGADPDGAQAMRCRGQLLSWDVENITDIHLLVASIGGDRIAPWRIGSRVEERRVPDMYEWIGVWDQAAPGDAGDAGAARAGWIKRDRLGWHATRLLDANGDWLPYTYAYLHVISVPVSSTNRTLQLPDDSDVLLFAATAISDPKPRLEPLNAWGLEAQPPPLMARTSIWKTDWLTVWSLTIAGLAVFALIVYWRIRRYARRGVC